VSDLEMNKWNEAVLLDRIIVWDRWIEKGIAPEGTKEARDAAIQIIIQRVQRLRMALVWLTNRADAAAIEHNTSAMDDAINEALSILSEERI
jgi:hypothetical protein